MESLGTLARNTYSKWLHHQTSVLSRQELNIMYELTKTKNYISKEILEQASQGAKFRRFYYNELDTSKLYYKPLSNYEIGLMLKNEELQITYDNDSFIVMWEVEQLK